jgi:hypothetical protein
LRPFWGRFVAATTFFSTSKLPFVKAGDSITRNKSVHITSST